MIDTAKPSESLLVNFPLSPQELDWLKEQRRNVRAVFDATYRPVIEAQKVRGVR